MNFPLPDHHQDIQYVLLGMYWPKMLSLSSSHGLLRTTGNHLLILFVFFPRQIRVTSTNPVHETPRQASDRPRGLVAAHHFLVPTILKGENKIFLLPSLASCWALSPSLCFSSIFWLHYSSIMRVGDKITKLEGPMGWAELARSWYM